MMKTTTLPRAARSATAALALVGALIIAAPVSAEDCGVLAPTTGNVVGSLAGAAAGGLIGNQFGKGTGQGVMTGVGVVGGALAGGYVGRQVEGCGRRPAPAPAAAGGPGRVAPRPAIAGDSGGTCRYVLTQAVIDGREQQINGVACVGQDGVWRTASGPAAERAAETDLVLRAQQALRDTGFYVRNNIDGKWGPATSNAVRNFQRANGLANNGQLDVPTQQSLGIGPQAVMAQADTAQPVAVQQALPPVQPVPVQPVPLQPVPARQTR
jgi:hypothetical protein